MIRNVTCFHGKYADFQRQLFHYFLFQDNINHVVLSLIYYVPPTLHRHNRLLGAPSLNDADDFDYRNDFMNFMKDPKIQKQRMSDRSLLIGGGSDPRLTLLLDRVQFLDNALYKKFDFYPASNGPIDYNTAFADVTVSQSFFKGNNYPFSRGEVVVSIKGC